MYAGFMPLNLDQSKNDEGDFFFWMARNRNPTYNPFNKKLLVWLNGGPGCSSMVGMMWENGPFTIHDAVDPVSNKLDYKLERNRFSWNEAADIVFVEQPIRTGYSTAANGAPIIHSEKQVARDFHNFLKSFLRVFTDLADAEVYISGESYAGMYIPSIAEYIVKAQLSDAGVSYPYINLQGVAIGNGVIDDPIQSASYTEYAYTHGLIPLGAKRQIDEMQGRCVEQAAARIGIATDDNDDCGIMGAGE
jgi:carboxypeptidase C (cathepsin A)